MPNSSALAMEDYSEYNPDDYSEDNPDDYSEYNSDDLSDYDEDGTDGYYQNNPHQISHHIRSRILPCCEECIVERVGVFNDVIAEYEYEYRMLLDIFDEESERYENGTFDNHVVNREINAYMYEGHCKLFTSCLRYVVSR